VANGHKGGGGGFMPREFGREITNSSFIEQVKKNNNIKNKVCLFSHLPSSYLTLFEFLVLPY
jgi:hypothetical protein